MRRSGPSCIKIYVGHRIAILLTKTTAAQNEDALRYRRVRGLYFQAVVFVATILEIKC